MTKFIALRVTWITLTTSTRQWLLPILYSFPSWAVNVCNGLLSCITLSLFWGFVFRFHRVEENMMQRLIASFPLMHRRADTRLFWSRKFFHHQREKLNGCLLCRSWRPNFDPICNLGSDRWPLHIPYQQHKTRSSVQTMGFLEELYNHLYLFLNPPVCINFKL